MSENDKELNTTSKGKKELKPVDHAHLSKVTADDIQAQLLMLNLFELSAANVSMIRASRAATAVDFLESKLLGDLNELALLPPEEQIERLRIAHSSYVASRSEIKDISRNLDSDSLSTKLSVLIGASKAEQGGELSDDELVAAAIELLSKDKS